MVGSGSPAEATFVLRTPPALHYGWGAAGRLGQVLKDDGIGRVLVVTDPGLANSGLVERALAPLGRQGIAWTLFAGVRPEPTWHNVKEGLQRFRGEGCEALVAVGGGSSIDCAKGISLAHTNAGDFAEFIGMEKVPHAGPPVYAVPTTAGTGSEVTRVLVLTDTDRSLKMMIATRHALCRAALVDAELTMSLPRPVTAATGTDALTHALEAYVSSLAQPLTDNLALSAIRRISAHLPRAYADGGDREARSQVMLGATEAGLAFSNASVALVHGMARPLGAFCHVPHGVAIGALLPLVTRRSWSADVERYAGAMEAMGERRSGESSEAAAARLPDLLHERVAALALPTRLPPPAAGPELAGVLATMAEQALASGSPQYNPWVPDHAEIVGIYKELFA